MTNFADDDLLLNTGVSFPIAFRRARVEGTEARHRAFRVSGTGGRRRTIRI